MVIAAICAVPKLLAKAATWPVESAPTWAVVRAPAEVAGQRRGLIAGECGDVLGGDRLDLCGAEGTDDGAGERGKLRGAQRAICAVCERGADRVELVSVERALTSLVEMAPNWALPSVR